jgi:hypothetical protein
MLSCPNDRLASVTEVDPAFRGDVLTGLSLHSQCRTANGCGMGKPLILTAIWNKAPSIGSADPHADEGRP